MWSIEKIDQSDSAEKDNDSDQQKMTINMIRIKPTTAPMLVDEEDEDPTQDVKEQGTRIQVGCKGKSK